MVEWLKIRDKNGDTYLVNVDDIACISKDGIDFQSSGRLWIPLDVEEVERAIAESRKTGEMIDRELAIHESDDGYDGQCLSPADIVRWIESD